MLGKLIGKFCANTKINLYKKDKGGSTVVKHSPQNPKIKGLNPAANTEGEKNSKRL